MTDPCPRPELLLAVAEGVLPGETAQQVEAHVAACPLCRQLQADLATFAAPTMADQHRLHRRLMGEPPRRFAWAAAAGVILAIALLSYGWVSRSQPPPARVAVNPKAEAVAPPRPVYRLALDPAPLRLPLALVLVMRGQAPSPSGAYLRDLGSALEPYRAGQYRASAEALAQLARQYPKAVEPPFYQGVALLLAGDAVAGRTQLERSQSIGGEALNAEIAWYLAIAYERTNTFERARGLLATLCASAPETPHRESACAALR